MLASTPEMDNFISQRMQQPLAICLMQTPTSDGKFAATQTVLGDILSYKISRAEDPSSDTCELTFADDTFDMSPINKAARYGALFAPGVIDNKFLVYLGFQGPQFFSPYGGPSAFSAYGKQLLLKFTGYLETDAEKQQNFRNDKTVSLIDLTKQFRFTVNDTLPHPLYGDQTYGAFDPTYNLTPLFPSGGNASQWICDGKMFTHSTTDLVYGSSHIDPAVYIGTVGSPSGTPMGAGTYSFDYNNGIVTLNTPVPVTRIVSLAGNPTHMAPEVMIRKLLTEKAFWAPNFLGLDISNCLIPQYDGAGKSLWQCIQEIAGLTNPRFIPWVIWADENGFLKFYEQRIDGPPVRTLLDGEDIFTDNIEFTAKNLRTVVRVDGTVTTSSGDQPIVCLAYDVNAITKYGQTETLNVIPALTTNMRQMSPVTASSYGNLMAAGLLAQVSRPKLTAVSTIWPDPRIQISDKIARRDKNSGLDREFIVKSTEETGTSQGSTETLSLEEVYESINFVIGIPQGVAGDGSAQASTTPPPATTLIGAVHTGSGVGAYPFQNGGYVNDPVTGDQILPIWNVADTTMHFDYFLNSLPAVPMPAQNPNKYGPFSYSNLPPGYGWTATINGVGQTVYYGTAPSGVNIPAGDRTFVGPDNVFRYFNHALPVTSSDPFWVPPGNTQPPYQGGSQGYTGTAYHIWVWQWWYLCLDGNLGPGKYFRYVQQPDPAGQALQQNVPATGGLWRNTPWSDPPGPKSGQSYIYGNVVAGVTDETIVPPGFEGANVMGTGVNLGCSFGAVQTGTGKNYVNYQKKTKGHWCLFAAANNGAIQYLRIPFILQL